MQDKQKLWEKRLAGWANRMRLLMAEGEELKREAAVSGYRPTTATSNALPMTVQHTSPVKAFGSKGTTKRATTDTENAERVVCLSPRDFIMPK